MMDLFYYGVVVLALVAVAAFYFSPFDLKIEDEKD
jgi:hypothetical protein